MRILYIDLLKGFLIITVVLGHAVQFTVRDFDHNLLFRFIYSFHMPLFIFLSGFVGYRVKLIWTTVKKRSFQLLLPFFSWWLMRWLILFHKDFTQHFINLIITPDTGLWFLWILFFCILLIHLSDKIANMFNFKQEIIVILGAIALNTIYLLTNFRFFGFQFLAWFYLFYCLGFYSRKYENIVFSKTKQFLLISTMLFPVGVFFWMRKDNPTFYQWINLGSSFIFLYKFIVAVLGILFFLYLFKLISKYNSKFVVPNLLINISYDSLGIYSIHFIILDFLLKIQFNLPVPMKIIMLSVVTLVCCYCIIRFIKLNKISTALLLGVRS